MPSNAVLLEKARSFLDLNARLLDRLRFRFHWEGGSAEAVLQALRAYQYPDGGFGQALEPDIRCPRSQPVPMEIALDILAETWLRGHALEEGISRWLEAASLPGGGWPVIRADAAGWPLAPWWQGLDDAVPSLNPTGSLLASLYRHGRPELAGQSWFQAAERTAWALVEESGGREPSGVLSRRHSLDRLPDRSS
jgi:hypothetical protein